MKTKAPDISILKIGGIVLNQTDVWILLLPVCWFPAYGWRKGIGTNIRLYLLLRRYSMVFYPEGLSICCTHMTYTCGPSKLREGKRI